MGKVVSLPPCRYQGGEGYISDSFLTSALDGSGQRHAPAALYPQYPLNRRLGGPQLVLTQKLEEKSFASAEDGTPVVHAAFSQDTALNYTTQLDCQ
jgi:hypothetical protein